MSFPQLLGNKKKEPTAPFDHPNKKMVGTTGFEPAAS